MQNDPALTRARHFLQRAGLSIPGTAQLLGGQALTDPSDRLALARLLAGAERDAGAGPPVVPPPLPPTPLPGVGPIMFGGTPRAARRGAGQTDSIWLELGFPVKTTPQAARRAGLSSDGIDDLMSARPLRSARDRALLAKWLGGPPGRSA